jgi:hypothetical protein
MGIEGKLTDLSLVDTLRILQRSARSGKIILSNSSNWALIWLLNGQVVNALVLTMPQRRLLHTSEAALSHLLTWSTGTFRFNPEDSDADYPITITQSTTMLLMTASQRQRTSTAPVYVSGMSLQTTLSVIAQVMDTSKPIRLNLVEWTILARIGQKKTLQQLVAETATSFEQVASSVSKLIDYGVVKQLMPDAPISRQPAITPASCNGKHQPAGNPGTRLTRAIKRRLQYYKCVELNAICI